jgi:signal transduction histidine kinase
VPVFDGERIVAVAGVGNKQGAYDESDVRQLSLLMESMWMLIHRHRVQAELREHRDELERLVEVRTAELAREAAERQRAYDELRIEQERLKGLLALQERERRLFAYEIHDGLSQHLVGALMELQSLQEQLPQQPDAVRQAFDHTQRLVGKGLDETRQVISGLRPFSLDEFGVESAINELILRGQTHRKPVVTFTSNLSGDRLEAMLENAVFRIVQECITNARRHSQSEEMNVALVDDGDWIQIVAEDWGIGFDVGRIPPGTFGLEGIRERAKLLGGSVKIDSQPGDGTRVVVRLPTTANLA